MAAPTPLPNPYKFPFAISKATTYAKPYAAVNPHYGQSTKSTIGPGAVTITATLARIGRMHVIVAGH